VAGAYRWFYEGQEISFAGGIYPITLTFAIKKNSEMSFVSLFFIIFASEYTKTTKIAILRNYNGTSL
jgi:hypothetical protein